MTKIINSMTDSSLQISGTDFPSSQMRSPYLVHSVTVAVIVFYTNYSNCSFLNSFKVTYIFLRCLFIWLKNKIIFSLFTKQLSLCTAVCWPACVYWVSRMRRSANIKLVKICKHYLWFPLSPETWLLKTLCNLITKSFQTQTNNLQQHYTSTGLIRKLSFLIFIDLYFLSFSLSDEWARNLYLIWSISTDSLEIF